jgi:hypothetical protein
MGLSDILPLTSLPHSSHVPMVGRGVSPGSWKSLLRAPAGGGAKRG